MRRCLMILPCLLALSGCSGGPPPAGPPVPGIRASFPAGGVTGVIEVDALDPQPVRAVDLIAPDGTATPASSLDVQANPVTIGGQRSIADPWRASMLGSNGVNPLPVGSLDPAVESRDQLLLTRSIADITLPDQVAYRHDWANYKLRLSFAGAGNQLDVRDIPAPAPPPER